MAHDADTAKTGAPGTGAKAPWHPDWLDHAAQWLYDHGPDGTAHRILPPAFFATTPPNDFYAMVPDRPLAFLGGQGAWFGAGGVGGGFAMQMPSDTSGGMLMQPYVQGFGSAKIPNPVQGAEPPAWDAPLTAMNLAPSFSADLGVSQSPRAFTGRSDTGSIGLLDPPVGLQGSTNDFGKSAGMFIGESPGLRIGVSGTRLQGPMAYLPYDVWSKLFAPDPWGSL